MISVQEHDDHAILTAPDRVDITHAPALKEHLSELYQKGFTTVLVDFTHVETLDSTGIGALLHFQKTLSESGGELRLINVTSEYIQKVFEIIELPKFISVETKRE